MSKKVKILPDDVVGERMDTEQPKSRQSRLMEAIVVSEVDTLAQAGSRSKTPIKSDDFPDSTIFVEQKCQFVSKEDAMRQSWKEKEKFKTELDKRDVAIRGEFNHNFDSIKKMMEEQFVRNQELNRSMIEDHLQKSQELNMSILK